MSVSPCKCSCSCLNVSVPNWFSLFLSECHYSYLKVSSIRMSLFLHECFFHYPPCSYQICSLLSEPRSSLNVQFIAYLYLNVPVARLSVRMSTNDLRGGQPDLLAEEAGGHHRTHLQTSADRHQRPPPHHKSRSRGLANIDPKFTSQVRHSNR